MVVTVARSEAAVRAALVEYAEREVVEQFDDELQAARRDKGEDVVEALLRRWQGLATIAANPLSPAERAQLDRARAGDFTGFRVSTPNCLPRCARWSTGAWPSSWRTRPVTLTQSTTPAPISGPCRSAMPGSWSTPLSTCPRR